MPQTYQLIGKTYCVRTFGCQMNQHDSERVRGLLDSCSCIEVSSPADADIVVFMTCCVREKADTRLYGQVSAMASEPSPPSGKRVVCIGGCIAQRDGESIREHIPQADVVFGTSALSELPRLIVDVLENPEKRLSFDIKEEGRGFSTDLPSKREQSFHAWVPIMYGCDNFCSFCVVPYVRGRERGRILESVVSECERLVEDGVREICLLGQNVNSYGRDLYGKPQFARLLRAVGNTGIERLRFTSSNPKDLNKEVIDAMAETPSVMPHLHLAVQSGSDKVLRAMNRRYTRRHYLELVDQLRSAIPDIALTTDIIVGFPGETEEDFLDTLSLVKEAQFSSAYTFIYSKREGTLAAKIKDDTPHSLIQERFERLVELVASQAHSCNQRYKNELVSVLFEDVSKGDASYLVGHSEHNITVHAPIPQGLSINDCIGKIAQVRVEEARTWYLRGSIEGSLI